MAHLLPGAADLQDGGASLLQVPAYLRKVHAGGVAPGAPVGMVATGVSSNQINTSWSAGTGDPPTSYMLQRSASGAGAWSTIYTGATASFQDTGLTASTTYDYRVSATNVTGTSANSAIFSGTTLAAGSISFPVPTSPLAHIGVVQDAFGATPIDSYMDSLVGGTPVAGYTRSVGFVFGSVSALIAANHIFALDPTIKFAAYTNITGLNGGTGPTVSDALEALLAYFDAHSFDREAAFIHTAAARAFSGGSASARPVRWFWGILRISAAGSLLNNYTQINSTTIASTFGAAVGDYLALGFLDRFRQIDVTIGTTLAGGYTYTLEYPTAVDGSGNPTAWSTLTALTDTTAGLTVNGSITWNPPVDWVPCSLAGSSACYFWARFRSTHTGTTPVASVLRSYDYLGGVDSAGAGTVPAFDSAVDAEGKGWLTAAQYATRAAGKDAWFRFQSRLPLNTYGSQRYAMYPSAQYSSWANSYYKDILDSNTRFTILFLDNNSLHLNNVGSGAVTIEDLSTFGPDWANLLTSLCAAIAPRGLWPHAYFGAINEQTGEFCSKACRSSWNESRLKPLKEDWTATDDTLLTYGRCLAFSPPLQFVGIDANFLPLYGSEDRTTDRTFMAAFAEFLQLHVPGVTWFSISGGDAGQSWQKTWRDAFGYDLGTPNGATSTTTGADPAKPSSAPVAVPSASGGLIADGTYFLKWSYGKTGSGACETLCNTTSSTVVISGGGVGSFTVASPAADGLTPGWFLYASSDNVTFWKQGTDSPIGTGKTVTALTLSGTNPTPSGQTYKIYHRSYTNPQGAVEVHYRPLSHLNATGFTGRSQGALCDSSAVTITPAVSMKQLVADGTRGALTASFQLRAGEGLILVL